MKAVPYMITPIPWRERENRSNGQREIERPKPHLLKAASTDSILQPMPLAARNVTYLQCSHWYSNTWHIPLACRGRNCLGSEESDVIRTRDQRGGEQSPRGAAAAELQRRRERQIFCLCSLARARMISPITDETSPVCTDSFVCSLAVFFSSIFFLIILKLATANVS